MGEINQSPQVMRAALDALTASTWVQAAVGAAVGALVGFVIGWLMGWLR